MGVHGLWRLAGRAEKTKTLREMGLESLKSEKTGFRALRVGIDTSMLMIMAEDKIWAEAGETGRAHLSPDQRILALRLLLRFSLSLFQNPTILPIFVYDGLLRPSIKRGRKIHRWAHQLERRLKSMCEGFAFEWFEAAGEAEWEIANLAKEGWVDAVWTGDSDIFLAAPPGLIIRLPRKFDDLFTFPSLDLLPLSTYTISDIQSPPHSIQCHTFIFLSMFLGGDYAPSLFPTTSERPYPLITNKILRSLIELSQTPYYDPSSPTSTSSTLSSSLISIAFSPCVATRTSLLSHWATSTLAHLSALDASLSRTLTFPPEWPSPLALSLYLAPRITPLSELLATGGPQFPSAPNLERIVDSFLDIVGMLPEEIVQAFEKESGVWEGIVRAALRREGLRRLKKGWFEFKFAETRIGEVPLEWRVVGEDEGRERVNIRVQMKGWVEELKDVFRIGVEADIEMGEGWEHWREFEVQRELVDFALGKLIEDGDKVVSAGKGEEACTTNGGRTEKEDKSY